MNIMSAAKNPLWLTTKDTKVTKIRLVRYAHPLGVK